MMKKSVRTIDRSKAIALLDQIAMIQAEINSIVGNHNQENDPIIEQIKAALIHLDASEKTIAEAIDLMTLFGR